MFFFFFFVVFFLERDLENGFVDKRTCLFLSFEREGEREKETRAIPSLSLFFFLTHSRARERETQTIIHGAECAREFFPRSHRVVVVRIIVEYVLVSSSFCPSKKRSPTTTTRFFGETDVDDDGYEQQRWRE